MSHPIFNKARISLSNLFFITFLIFPFNEVTTAAQDSPKIIGAVIDANTRIGKEQKISMKIAIQAFNNALSNKHKLALHVTDSGGKPMQASVAADYLIKVKQVQAIVGMETWQEAVFVAEIANKAQVPVLSFSAPANSPPVTSMRWPFLVRAANNNSLQMGCVASIVRSYEWRRVIAIYEDDGYSTNSGIITLLSDALQAVGAEVEHWLVFPLFTTLSDPKPFIQEELEKLKSKQSRVFIIAGSSLELASYILTEAKHVGLMGEDSVWITTDSVTNLLHTVNSSVISSMQGIIGIKTYFSMTSPSFLIFSTKFRNIFRSIYPEEDKSEPGIYALRAYDVISTVALALEKSTINRSNSTSRTLLGNILSSNFNGLSGKIQLENGELSQSATYEIINGVGQGYSSLKFWSPQYGFSDSVIDGMSTQERNKTGGGNGGAMQVLGGRVYWPEKLERVPLGRVMPTDVNKMLIGVPGRTSFEKFVKVKDGEPPTGFCIDVFNHAVKLLNYKLLHKFVPFYGTYDDLVDQVYFKKFDAVVGDVTILANRSKYVEFTQPYAESGLRMVVPVKLEGKAWLFAKPFTMTLWTVVSIVFVYTMFVVWFLEHGSNPEFGGSLKNQLSTAMWFTFSTLFFAHREGLRSNFTRVVMFVWLFTVFVVTSSYTASLTSMLTVQRLEPTVTDVETLRRSNSHVGCDGDSFIRKYIEKVLHFHPNNIINITTQYDYPDAFKNGTIKAAFLELPYERVFLTINSKDYQDTGLDHRFGGLGFVFPKGSAMAADFSKAFLRLSEDGTLNRLDKYWFKSSSQSSNSDNNMNNQSLSLSNFWALFLVTGLTTTIMLVLYIVQHGEHNQSNIDSVAGQARDVEESIPPNGERLSQYHTPRHPKPTQVNENEMRETYVGESDSQTRPLRLYNSFPGPDRRVHGYN